LLRQLAEVEAAGQMERERRREVEAALAEASAIFKRELADKNGQLELQRQEIRWVSMWEKQCGVGGIQAESGRRAMHVFG
jgi:Tfp pilus assembly protein PilE